MSYSINGTELTLQPTSGRWMPREILQTDGNGHPVYSAVREFELQFVLVSPSELNQIQTFFDNLNITGSVVASLPKYANSSYTFYSYSGCVLNEPEIGDYFNQNHTNVVVRITNIRT